MANENGSKVLTLTDRNVRKLRKNLTRDKDGSFEVCPDHERRMRAESFNLVISADGSTGEVTIRATANLSCGHSKNPCKDSKSRVIADGTGVSDWALRTVGAADTTDDDEEIGEAA